MRADDMITEGMNNVLDVQSDVIFLEIYIEPNGL
jgi:hypothetical protein